MLFPLHFHFKNFQLYIEGRIYKVVAYGEFDGIYRSIVSWELAHRPKYCQKFVSFAPLNWTGRGFVVWV